ncbi:MAG: hypothetical protein ACRD4Y_07825, partial [Candidatus Acidiferrales bacterium]
VMVGGKRTAARTNLAAAQERCRSQVLSLPEPLRSLNADADSGPVRHSEKLELLLGEVRRRLQRAAGS